MSSIGINAHLSFSTDTPEVAISYQDSTNQTITSSSQLLLVVAEEGDPAPTFACSAHGSPAPVLSWVGSGGAALPSGVSLMANRLGGLDLVWTRALQYRDSGDYQCVASNSIGTETITLQLLVRRES